MTRYLFLDTATRYTGYAVFEKALLNSSTAMLVQYGLLKGGSKTVDDRIITQACKFETLIGDVNPISCVQEFPYFQEGMRGASAARSGDTLQLARMCGHFEQQWLLLTIAARAEKIALPVMINVQYNQWNGQLPKKVTCERCALHFDLMIDDPDSIDNNWADAIMMGKWFIEKKLKMATMRGGNNTTRKDY